jgi:hypothetical protein
MRNISSQSVIFVALMNKKRYEFIKFHDTNLIEASCKAKQVKGAPQL